MLPGVFGVDQSLTCTGFVSATEMEVYGGTIEPDSLRGIERLFYVRARILKIIERDSPRLVVFEDYVLGMRSGTGRLAHLGEIGGVLKLAVWERGIDVLVVPSGTLKLAITGKGNADKNEVARALEEDYGYLVGHRSRDESDALGLALVGDAYLGGSALSLTSKQRRSISNCELTPGKPSLR